MACQEFAVLYTHQKMKKSKVWQDGILKYTISGNKAVLCDVKGQVLDSIFVKFQVKSGDDLESERYLITVEAEKTPGIDGGNNQSKNTEVPMLTANNSKSCAPSLHLPVGLKRKFSGFKGPRPVEKKMATMEKPIAMASPKCPESLFPSQFCLSSPLFSVAYRNKNETNLLPVFKGDATMNSSDIESITSVVSPPYIDDHKMLQNLSHPADAEHLKPESQLDNGLFNLNYHASNSVAVSQNNRSKGQIIALLESKTALLGREQKHSIVPDCEHDASLNYLIKSDYHPEGLPLSESSRNIDFQQKMAPVLGSVNGPSKESTRHVQYIAGKYDAAPERSYDRPGTHPVDCEAFSNEPQMHKDEQEDMLSASEAFDESTEENEKNSPAVSSSNLPKRTNGFSLLRSLTEHSTALESLQMIEGSPDISCERGILAEQHRSSEGPRVKQGFTEVSYPEDALLSSSCSGAPKMHSSLSDHVEKPTAAIVKWLHGPNPVGLAESQSKNVSKLLFPSAVVVINCTDLRKRQMCIPTEFQSSALYKQVFTAALTEHLNILLFELSQRLHKALGKVDISFYTSVKGGQEQTQDSSAPFCHHKIAAKLVMVKKQGRNKGRLFYACDAPKAERCDFFKWLDDVNPGQIKSRPSVVFHDTKSIGNYLRSQNIFLHEECQLLVRKSFDIQRKRFSKMKKFNVAHADFDCEAKSKLYLKLSRKEHSSMYSKDDLWVISKTLMFEQLDTFIACSVFFGPSSSNEIELELLEGYSPSNWRSNMIVHALLVCNVSTELTTLRNIEEHFSSATLPIMQHLLTNPFKKLPCSNKVNKRKFKPPVLNPSSMNCGLLSPETTISLANEMIQTFQLNKDQAMALLQIGNMMASHPMDKETGKQQSTPITIIHGVFGSGKSYLLAIVILFLVQIFETSEATDGKKLAPWKILISSSTNVAVDRVLLCLLDLGFEEFIRVGSVRKIAKPILPHSLHAGSGPESEQLKELLALMKEDLTPAEKNYVRKTIEHHRLGTNKALLQQVRVVGVTCAACPFPCMKNLKFPIVVLDECSQMTEPASLLPIARFGCEKLILVGDPKQLPPTIQGSESAHDKGLEQTLFDRLCLMGHDPVLLRTQYRCHPAISAISCNLFYDGNLLDGISKMDRNPLVDWLPTLCFYNVNGSEQMERDNSFYNLAESFFSVKLIQSLIASGIAGSVIGVITLYKSQMSKISSLLAAVDTDASQIKAVQVSTVDAFQGAEKEIIVLSCVRTGQVGFIDSETRVNVALTRGKRHLLIVGNLNCLRKSNLWGNVIQHCAGNKDGLQHVSQCEQKLNDILKSYMERKKAEERKLKEKSKSKSLSQKTDV
ncbi:protein ZGRF1 isoform X4 [Sphaerodactylus townsendi]|uniref:protein ZGRF1 isoform X4 n=1 Tax=Sphaerodactylus townsendi TaxID=933632 RepID=UPI00202653B4|nr:protein ZGRF1 isoform X4 [Sphaerodactylus townsendi]